MGLAQIFDTRINSSSSSSSSSSSKPNDEEVSAKTKGSNVKSVIKDEDKKDMDSKGKSVSKDCSILKKPACSLKDKVKTWMKGTAQPEEDKDEDDAAGTEGDDTGGDEKRDKGKARQFGLLRSSLPEHIISMYDDESKTKTSKRSWQTQVVNKLFLKDETTGSQG